MKKSWLFCLSFFTLQTVFACTVVDDQKHVLTLPQPAKRIISLAPDLTELLFAAGAGHKIVGVMHGSDYPPLAKKMTQVASYNQIDAEKIVALHPDLVVVWAQGGIAEQVKKLGIPVYVSEQHALTDIPATLQRLGCLAGTQQQADQAAAQFTQHYETLKKHYSQPKNIKVFYQVGSRPLMTISKNSWISDVITLCGGKNIFADLHGAAPSVDVEAVLKANPDVIVASEGERDWQKQWERWPQINAVKYHRLFTINSDLLERASPRILTGAEQMCRWLEVSANHPVVSHGENIH